MRKILLASVGIIISTGTTYAACIPTPSCSSLGYESSSSCEGGIKCPFGNAWNCTLVDKINEITTEITEIKKVIEESGVGGGGKDTSNCKIGSIFYSDWTCSTSLDSSKTPIAVVVYISGEGHGQAMALKSIGNYKWAQQNSDLSLNNFVSDETASTDFQSYANTIIITAAGDKSKYPAAWAAHEYKTEGTNTGDWGLPAAGIITSIKNNTSIINAGFILTGGIQIKSSSCIWSSSEYSNQYAWLSDFNSVYGLVYRIYDPGNYYYPGKTDLSAEVRPVLEF